MFFVESFSLAYQVAALAILAVAVSAWLVSLWLADASIVDLLWGLLFVIIAWIAFVLTPEGLPERRLIVCALVTIWGVRLSLWLLWRNWGQEEDFRYQSFRRRAGSIWWWYSLFKVFLLQGGLALIVAAPIVAAQATDTALGILDYAAVGIWLLGFACEAIGDWQLARFKSHPENAGKVMQQGLWRYSRHPNYFGDALQWWGIFLLAAASSAGLWTVFGPVLMTFLLLQVSGVAMMERRQQRVKPEYKTYMETTSAFVPLPPRKPNTDR